MGFSPESSVFARQSWDLYTEQEHRIWSLLYWRMKPSWERFANPHFLEGLEALQLDPTRIPRLTEVNRFLSPLTGFEALPVSGYLPAFLFFDCLRNRQFPTTVTIRDTARIDYLPEPDIFHDIAGHVPMHTDPAFAEALVRVGACAHTAADLASSARDEDERVRRLTGMMKALARFFWFTVEFGLMRSPDGLRVYGSGLLSSHSEIEHAIEAPEVQRHPLRLEWVVNQSFEIDRYQSLLFWVDDFPHLYHLADTLENWMREGRLDNVAPGNPPVNEADLLSFLHAGELSIH